MKLSLIFIFLIFSCSYNLNAQAYNYFDCTWFELGESSGPAYANIRYQISEDTTSINGVDYFRVQFTQEEEGDFFFDTQGLVRFEGNQIYEIDDFSQEEFILYDFDIEEGDTLITRRCIMEVTAIDSVQLLNGTMRKRMSLNYLFGYDGQTEWIEGIGDIFGFFNPRLCSASPNIALLCHYNQGELLYENPAYEGCWITSISDVAKTYLPIISPNPATNYIYIEQQETITELTLKLFALDGKQVLQETIKDNLSEIDVSQIAKGVYFYQIYNHKTKTFSNGKLIIQ